MQIHAKNSRKISPARFLFVPRCLSLIEVSLSRTPANGRFRNDGLPESGLRSNAWIPVVMFGNARTFVDLPE